MKSLLIGMCGLPRSGKSTKADKISIAYTTKGIAVPIVNPDSIRLALHGKKFEMLAEPFVWAVAQTMVRALFLAGHPIVIVDATNVSRKRRQMWINRDWDTQWCTINTPAAICIERAGDDRDLVRAIERMAKDFEIPGADEGDTCLK